MDAIAQVRGDLRSLRISVHRMTDQARANSRQRELELYGVVEYLRRNDGQLPVKPYEGWNRRNTENFINAAYGTLDLAVIIGKLRENKCYHHPRCPECLTPNGNYIRRIHAVRRDVAKQAGHRICMPGSCCRGFWDMSAEQLGAEDEHASAINVVRVRRGMVSLQL